MKTREKERGYTLIELLAVCVILGVISTILVVAINKINKNMKDVYYEKQNKSIIISAKEFYANNKELLPKKIGEQSFVLINDLVSKDYIKPIYSYKKKLCSLNSNELKVTVTKINHDKYHYSLYFMCENYESKIDTTAPTITYTPNEKTVSNKQIEVNVKAIDEKDGSGILKIDWIIFKNDIPNRQASNLTTEQFILRFIEEGTYSFKITAMDQAGNRAEVVSPLYVVDKTPPEKPIITLNTTSWTNKTVTATIKTSNDSVKLMCKIDEGSYTNCSDSSKTIDNNGRIYAKSYDLAGNSSEGDLLVSNIDKILPSVSFNPISGNIITQPVNITVSDNGSGFLKFRYAISVDNGVNWGAFSDFIMTNTVDVKLMSPTTNKIKVEAHDQAGNILVTTSNSYDILEDKPQNPNIYSSETGCSMNTNITIEFTGNVVKQYKIGNGSYQTYTGPFWIYNNTTIYAKAISASGRESDVISLRVSNIKNEQYETRCNGRRLQSRTCDPCTRRCDSWYTDDSNGCHKVCSGSSSWKCKRGAFVDNAPRGHMYIQYADEQCNSSNYRSLYQNGMNCAQGSGCRTSGGPWTWEYEEWEVRCSKNSIKFYEVECIEPDCWWEEK